MTKELRAKRMLEHLDNARQEIELLLHDEGQVEHVKKVRKHLRRITDMQGCTLELNQRIQPIFEELNRLEEYLQGRNT